MGNRDIVGPTDDLERKPVRVYIVDDHALVREPLATVLAAERWITVVGHCGTVREALRDVPAARPDVVLVDLRLGDDDGLDLCGQLVSTVRGVRVIVMTAFPARDVASKVITAGASGWIAKSSAVHELLHAIRTVADGQRYAEPPNRGPLTAQEVTVLRLYTGGKPLAEIANELGIGRTTVDEYLRRCVQKLEAENRRHAAAIAVRRGYL